jgi:hypothetical protein
MTDPTEKPSTPFKLGESIELRCDRETQEAAAQHALQKPAPKSEGLPVRNTAPGSQSLKPWCQYTNYFLLLALISDVACWILPMTPLQTSASYYVFCAAWSFFAAGLFVKMLGVAHDNLELNGIKGLKFDGPGTIYAWFIPVLNLYYPFLVMLETFRGSDPRTQAIAGPADRSTVRPVMRWWIATLLGYVFCWVPAIFKFLLVGAPLGEFTLWPTHLSIMQLIFWSIVVMCRIVAVLQLRSLLHDITHWQSHRFPVEETGSAAKSR